MTQTAYDKVALLLQASGGLSVADMVNKLGIPRGTISNLLYMNTADFRSFQDGNQVTWGLIAGSAGAEAGNGRVREPELKLTKLEKDVKKFERPREFSELNIADAPDGYKIIIVNDTQIPFQDPKTLQAVHKFWDDFGPDLEVYNGDIIDFYSISSFDKNPTRAFKLQDELDDTYAWLFSRAEANPSARRIFIEGNHEDRLRRFLWKEATDLSSLRVLNFEELMRFKELGMEDLTYMSVLDFLGFRIQHGWKASGGSTPWPINVGRFMAQKEGSSGLCGHTHRASIYCWTTSRGSHSYVENGCLCRFDLEFAPFPNWQQAFSYGEVKNGKVHTKLVQIYPDGFIANGEFYPRK